MTRDKKRDDIDNLLLDKLSDTLSKKQKRKRVGNLLYEMSYKDESIAATGPRKSALWRLREKKRESGMEFLTKIGSKLEN